MKEQIENFKNAIYKIELDIDKLVINKYDVAGVRIREELAKIKRWSHSMRKQVQEQRKQNSQSKIK